MEITDLKLGFLWEKRVCILDGVDPFDEKWLDHQIRYGNFISNEALEKIIALMLITFKDKFPDEHSWYTSFYSSFKDVSYEEDGYECIDGKHLIRKDLSKYSSKLTEDKKHGLEYLSAYKFDFIEPIELTTIIEENLVGKNYTKEVGASSVLYKVQDSPIAEIETSSQSFSLSINEAYFIEFVTQ